MFAGLVVALAAAAQPVTEAPAVPGEEPTIVVEGERRAKKVCKKGRPPTGSRLGSRRICRTQFEWKMSQEAAQRTLEEHETHERAMRAYEQNQKNGLADKVTP
jgi:hypothetical protein